LYEHLKKIWFDAEFHKREAAFIDWQKKQESERLGIQTVGWTGKKRGVIPFVDHFCTALGFERRRNRWQKKLDCGLIFEVSLDLGGNPNRIGAPLVLRTFHTDDPKFAFELGGNEPFEELVYGSRLYGGGGEASKFVLGIRATLSCSMSSPYPLILLRQLRI
jgi:hypothetical protein